MGKLNLSEAAKEILGGNISSKQSGQDKSSKLPTSVAYGTQDVGSIGTDPVKHTEELPDYLKGTPKATPPGATPPVGSQPASKLSGQPQQTQGVNGEVVQSDADEYEDIRDRKSGVKPKQTFSKNANATFDTYAEEKECDDDEDDEDEDKKSKMKERMKEDMDALLSGENLSEEFVSRATTIFEAAVMARSEEVIAEAEAQLVEQFEMAVEEVKFELAEKVDSYLNYMIEQWVKENELAITKGLRAEIVEDFISGLRNLFVEHYIDIPEEKVDVVEELTTRVEELENALNEQILSTVELNNELNEHKKIEAVYEACEGLTQTQVEKMKALAEGVEYSTEEEFIEKLNVIRESYFKVSVKASSDSSLNEGVEVEEEKKTKVVSEDPSIDLYAKTISQTLSK
jgi:hypothetical protein